MSAFDIVVLGAEGVQRTTLEATVRRLGHESTAIDPEAVENLSATGDVVMVDLRDDTAHLEALTEELLDDERPLILVADRPRQMISTLSSRPAGTLLLTGAEDDSGYRVALTLAAAFSRPRTSAGREAGWTAPTVRAAAAQ